MFPPFSIGSTGLGVLPELSSLFSVLLSSPPVSGLSDVPSLVLSCVVSLVGISVLSDFVPQLVNTTANVKANANSVNKIVFFIEISYNICSYKKSLQVTQGATNEKIYTGIFCCIVLGRMRSGL